MAFMYPRHFSDIPLYLDEPLIVKKNQSVDTAAKKLLSTGNTQLSLVDRIGMAQLKELELGAFPPVNPSTSQGQTASNSSNSTSGQAQTIPGPTPDLALRTPSNNPLPSDSSLQYSPMDQS